MLSCYVETWNEWNAAEMAREIIFVKWPGEKRSVFLPALFSLASREACLRYITAPYDEKHSFLLRCVQYSHFKINVKYCVAIIL